MKTRALKIGLLLLVVVTTSSASATQVQIPDGLRLRRMSLLLRGYLPSSSDSAELRATPERARKEFFQRKLREYTSDVLFRRKFAWRTKALFRLRQDLEFRPDETLGDFEAVKSPVREADSDATDALTKLLGEEKSWDDLMSSPAFAYQQALRNALLQVQSDFTRVTIGTHYNELAQFLRYKNRDQVVRRIRAHIKGEGPITLQEVQIPEEMLKEARLWAILLARYDIDINVDLSTNAKAIDTLRQLNFGFKKFENESHNIVRRFSESFFYFLKPDFEDYRKDRALISESNFRKAIRVFQNASHLVSAQSLNLSEIALRSSIMDKVLDAAEDYYLRGPSSGPYRISLPEAKQSLEAAAVKLWEEGQFQAGMPLILSDELRARYNQTKYSLSAAFYRIYFCDEMKLVSLAKDDELSRLANQRLRFKGSGKKAQAQAQAQAPAQPGTQTAEQRHASDPLCQGCHRKLDPVQNIANEDGKVSGAIKIVYDDENGKEQSFIANSPAELIREIKSQRMYQICQVRRFWNWYIGEDVPLTGLRLEQMLTSYRNHKSIPEFVRTVVSQPEFSRIPQVTDKLTFEGVRPILSRCNDCHSTEALMPSFTQTPFALFAKGEEARAEHVEWLHKIVKMTDLVHGAKNAKMPPKEAGWTLDNTAVHQLARWVYFLAPDAQGRPTINSTQRDQILADASPEFLEKITLDEPSKPSFRSTYRRYLEGVDFLKVIHQIFQIASDTFPLTCQVALTEKSSAFGWPDPLTGAPKILAPGGDFQMTWAKCVEFAFKNKYPGQSTRQERNDEARLLNEILERGDVNQRQYDRLLRRLGELRDESPAYREIYKGRPYEGSLSPVLADSVLNNLRQIYLSHVQDRAARYIPTETLLRKLTWSALPQGHRSELIAHLVQFAYPEGVFPQSTIAYIRSDLHKTLDQLSTTEKLDLYYIIRSSLILLLSREEFLTI
ncbi:MAG: hypothetical protein AB7G93_05785 [Bdellovibrionales bacterium]